jgi:hypothetical protein
MCECIGVFINNKKSKDMNVKYARVCDVTGEGMNEGWVWGDGTFYTKYEKDTLAECREDRDAILFDMEELTIDDIIDWNDWNEFSEAIDRAKKNKDTDEDLLLIAYQTSYLYYTEWEDEDEFQYEEINGILKEL